MIVRRFGEGPRPTPGGSRGRGFAIVGIFLVVIFIGSLLVIWSAL